MSREDLYTRWLDIPEGKRPPDHYTLLGLPRLCRDEDTINKAVQTQLKRLDPYQIHSDREMREACVQMRNEIAQAGVVLLDPKRRRSYERQFFGDGTVPPELEESDAQGMPDDADETADPWGDTCTEIAGAHDWIEVELQRSERMLGGLSNAEGLTPHEQPEAVAGRGRDAARSSRLTPIAIAVILMAISAFSFHRATWPPASSQHADEAPEPPVGPSRDPPGGPERPIGETMSARCEVAVREPDSERGRQARRSLASLSDTDLLRQFWTVVFDERYSSLSPVLLMALQAKCEHLRANASAAARQAFRTSDVEALMRGFRRLLPPRDRGPVRKLLLDMLRTKCAGLSRDRAIALVTNEFAGVSEQEQADLLKALLTERGAIYLSSGGLRRFSSVEPGSFVLACLRSERAAPEFKAAVPGILAELWAELDGYLAGSYRQPLAAYALGILDVTATLEFAATWPADVDVDQITDLVFESLGSDDKVVQAAAEAACEALSGHLTGERLAGWIRRLREVENARCREISRVALAGADGRYLKDLIPSFLGSEEADDREMARESLFRTDPNHLGDVIPLFLNSEEPADHAAARRALSHVETLPHSVRVIAAFLGSPDPNDQQIGMERLEGLARAARRDVLREVFTASGNGNELRKRIYNAATGSLVTDVAIAILEDLPSSSEEERTFKTRVFFEVVDASTGDDAARSGAERCIRTWPIQDAASLLILLKDGGLHDRLVKAIVRRMDRDKTGEHCPRLRLFQALPTMPDDVLTVVLPYIDTGGEQEMVSQGVSGLADGEGGLGKPGERTEFRVLVRSLKDIIVRSSRADTARSRAVRVLSHCNRTREDNEAQRKLNEALEHEMGRPEDRRNELLLAELEKHYLDWRKQQPDNPYPRRSRSGSPRIRQPRGR